MPRKPLPTLALAFALSASLFNAPSHAQCVDGALTGQFGNISPSGWVYTDYRPFTLWLPGPYVLTYVGTGGSNTQNFTAILNGIGWSPLSTTFVNAGSNEIGFRFYHLSPTPLCSSETFHIKFHHVGLGNATDCTYDLTVVTVDSAGSRQNLTFVNGISKAYYAGSDYRVHVMTWNPAQQHWDYAPVNVAAGWGSVQVDGQLASFADGTRVFFRGKNNRLYNLVHSGTNWTLPWTLSQVLSTLPDVAGRVAARNSNEVVFVGSDKQLHRVLLVGSTWVDQIVAPQGGWGNLGAPDANSISLPSGSTDIFLATGTVGRLYKAGSIWNYEPISPVNVYDSDNGDLLAREPNVVYFKAYADKAIHRYVKNGSVWTYDPMTISAASEANVKIRNPYLTKFAGEDRIFYKASTGRIYNLYKQNGVWYNYALNSAFTSTAGDLIATEEKVFYINHDKRVHNFYWTGNSWWDVPLSSATQASTRGCIYYYYN